MKTLYVGNLDYRTSKDEIIELFEPFGEIFRITEFFERGFCFIEYGNPLDANKAQEQLNGRVFNGRLLRINEARPKQY